MTFPIATKDIERSIGWIDRVIDLFKPYKSEIRKVIINYKTKRTEVHLFIPIPNGFKRRIAKIVIPAYEGLRFEKMLDEMFNEIKVPFVESENGWVLNPLNLPNSDRFLIVLSGSFPEDTLSQLVRIQPSRNKDSTPELDRFWLDSMLRNPEIVETMWRALDIDEVNLAVKVGIQNLFSAVVPSYIKRNLEATQKLLAAGHGKSRDDLFRAWMNMKIVSRESELSVDEVIKLIETLTSGELFSRYVTVDSPYELGDIRRDALFKEFLPERMAVEAKTLLNLKRPTATGYLSFHKKKYEEELRKNFDSSNH
jgi:hypothetical protein